MNLFCLWSVETRARGVWIALAVEGAASCGICAGKCAGIKLVVELWSGLVASNKEQHSVNERVRETSNGTAYLGTPETAGAIDLMG